MSIEQRDVKQGKQDINKHLLWLLHSELVSYSAQDQGEQCALLFSGL